MKHRLLLGGILLAVIALVAIEPAIAGPGGKIASAAFGTFWGRVILVLLTIVLLPVIVYVIAKEKIAEKRARKDLAYMSRHDARFNWLKIQQRVKDCFYRVHAGWQDENLSDVSDWMTAWYWQNQQRVFLDRWKKDGLVNICKVKKITGIKPLLFAHNNEGGIAHEGSMIAVSITANMQDYLQHRASGKIVEGDKRFKDVETIWSFVMNGGVWRVSDIEDGAMSTAYADAVKELPKIETTLLGDRARQTTPS